MAGARAFQIATEILEYIGSYDNRAYYESSWSIHKEIAIFADALEKASREHSMDPVEVWHKELMEIRDDWDFDDEMREEWQDIVDLLNGVVEGKEAI